MSHGENAEKNSKFGKEWWGKRPFSGVSISVNKGMKIWKRLLHKKERNMAKDDLRERIREEGF